MKMKLLNLSKALDIPREPCFIENWCYTKPNLVPNENEDIVKLVIFLYFLMNLLSIFFKNRSRFCASQSLRF